MPSFDVVSEVDKQEVDNALNQAKKEIQVRFDLKGMDPSIEVDKEGSINLSAKEASPLNSLREVVLSKLAKRNVDLRNIDREEPDISPLGHAKQRLKIKQGLDGDKAKEIVKAIKGQGLPVQAAIQERQIRVTGKKRDDLQAVIAFLRSKDFGVALSYTNFRD